MANSFHLRHFRLFYNHGRQRQRIIWGSTAATSSTAAFAAAFALTFNASPNATAAEELKTKSKTSDSVLTAISPPLRPNVRARKPLTTDEQHAGIKCQTGDHKPRIMFLGTGSSTGCPRPLCSLLFSPECNVSSKEIPNEEFEAMRERCRVSVLASEGNPRFNRNYRNNPSIVISHCNGDDNDNDDSIAGSPRFQHVVIDVGKTFREAALRFMPQNCITAIDAVVLTHEHMDSIGGLDDLRGFQKRILNTKPNSSSTGGVSSPASSSQKKKKPPQLLSIPIYLTDQCYMAIKKQFHYLVPKTAPITREAQLASASAAAAASVATANDTDIKKNTETKKTDMKEEVKRLVASLDYKLIHAYQPFIAAGLVMTPLPVMHGEDMICMGYAFSIRHCDSIKQERNNDYEDNSIDNDGQSAKSKKNKEDEKKTQKPQTNIVYLSDISRMLPETKEYILSKLPQPLDILIIDSLRRNVHNPTHICLKEAIDIAKSLKAKRVYIVGINCDDFLPHDEMNEWLQSNVDEEKVDGGLQVRLPHDGLVLEISSV